MIEAGREQVQHISTLRCDRGREAGREQVRNMSVPCDVMEGGREGATSPKGVAPTFYVL